jgi:hypothetical protein
MVMHGAVADLLAMLPTNMVFAAVGIRTCAFVRKSKRGADPGVHAPTAVARASSLTSICFDVRFVVCEAKPSGLQARRGSAALLV